MVYFDSVTKKLNRCLLRPLDSAYSFFPDEDRVCLNGILLFIHYVNYCW